MQPISTLFGEKRFSAGGGKQTERGDIMDALLGRLNPPRIKKGYQPISHKRLAFLLTAIPTKDLYALVSKCDDAERRGVPWSAAFWTEIRPVERTYQT